MNNVLINMLNPGFIMMFCGIIVLFLPEKCRVPISIAGPIAATISFFTTMNPSASLKYVVTDFINLEFVHVDDLANAFMLTFCIILIAKSLFCITTQSKIEAGCTMLYSGSMMAAVLAGDCISLLVFWETAAIASAAVVFLGGKQKSYRAAFRYLLVHAFGGNMFLVGMLVYIFHYGNTLTNISSEIGTPMFWLIFIGVAVNAAVPPLNSWLSDAYPEASITGTPYLASFTTKVAIYVLIRLFAGSQFLVWVGVFMAIYAACMAIMENGMRRLLSYHIVSQLGMMIAALGVGSEMGIAGATAHAITNIFFKGALMLCVGAIIYATGKTKITEVGGLGKRMPVVSMCFLISSLAIAGLPGLSGFVSKALVTGALEEAGYTAALVLINVAGVGTLLSITLKMNYFIFWGPCDEEAKNLEIKPVPWSMNLAMIIATIMSVLIGFFPQQFYAIMPFGVQAHPYHIGHVLEYIIMIAGGTIPFVFFLKRMKPHDELTIDFDWFYRRPFNTIVRGIAKVLYNIFDFCEEKIVAFARYLGFHFSNPYRWIEKSSNLRIKNMSIENEEHLIGDALSITVGALVLMIVLAAIAL